MHYYSFKIRMNGSVVKGINTFMTTIGHAFGKSPKAILILVKMKTSTDMLLF